MGNICTSRYSFNCKHAQKNTQLL
uniref:Uncharacterized protein n=1 Tax=Arundo donax TaxID=35708 RepID=A0A0A8Z7W1_ARUDO